MQWRDSIQELWREVGRGKRGEGREVRKGGHVRRGAKTGA